MRTAESTREQDAVETLCGDEAALEVELATARREAAARLASARREAEAIAADARRAVERELHVLRCQAAEVLERLGAEARDADGAAAAELARRAEVNRARAVDRALAVVLGGAP